MSNLRDRRSQFISLVILVSLCLVAFAYLPQAYAAMTISVLNPSAGPVGTVVAVTGNLTTSGGNYTLFFDDQVVASGAAAGQDIVVNFSVPQTYLGTHNVILSDLTANENASRSFIVVTSYDVHAVAEKKFQEGDQVPIVVNITGGDKSSTFNANITVTTPTPNTVTYINLTSFPTSALGTGLVTLNFPRDFPSAANQLVGTYGLHLNNTLVNATFSVGLTNSSEYHRHDFVNIKALYQPGELVTLTISGKDVNNPANVTADPVTGIVNYDWPVPGFADVGSYLVTILSANGTTRKTPSDSQNFTVPGFATNVTAKNLAGETVQGVSIEAYESAPPSPLADSQTTNVNGTAFLKLEIGDYNCLAKLSGQIVGQIGVSIQNTTAPSIDCNLTNLRVQVVAVLNGSEVAIPEAVVILTPQNNRTSTDEKGIAVFHSLLPNATAAYVLNLTRYSNSFNGTAIANLLVNSAPVAWFDVKVICPSYPLQVIVTKANGQPLGNAVVKIQEGLGVPLYEEQVNADGVASFNAPFGMYTVQVYDSSMTKLNQTIVQLFGNQTVTVSCNLYGLTATVKVVDYFGQGIANLAITLKREGQLLGTVNTGGDGVATFSNVVGGEWDISIASSGSSTPLAAQSLIVDSTMIGPGQTVAIPSIIIGEYTVLAGMLVQTSQLAAIIVVVLIVVLALLIELFVIRRRKSHKTETETADKDS